MNVNYQKVICISEHTSRTWTLAPWYDIKIGEIYNVVEYETIDPHKPNKLYRTDNNKYYPIELFITIEQYREQQLNKLI